MKRWISFFSHLALFGILTSFVTFTAADFKNGVKVPEALKVKEPLEVAFPSESVSSTKTNWVLLDNTFMGFKEAVAFKESQGDYLAINTLGYMGKYQFGKNTLKLMGVYDTAMFINNPKLQEKVFKLNVARNKWILRRDIKRFVGKRINGTTITESGIVAAAHLAGAGNVKKYLRSYGQNDFSDAYGSNIAHYMKKFANFDISEVKAEHNPKI